MAKGEGPSRTRSHLIQSPHAIGVLHSLLGTIAEGIRTGGHASRDRPASGENFGFCWGRSVDPTRDAPCLRSKSSDP